MKKLLFFVICLLSVFISCFLPLSASSYTIKGGISYTEAEARKCAFKDVLYKIEIDKYKDFFTDKNFLINQEKINKGKKKYKNRYLTRFSKGEYAVRYIFQPSHAYYYNIDGILCYIDIDLGHSYPKQRVTYDSKGILDSVTLDISANEQFIFDTNKKLVAHWIGNNCYNNKGELIDTRH